MGNYLRRYTSEKEESFFEARLNFLNSNLASPELIAENPFLFSSRQGVSDSLARIELFMKVSNIPGYIVECGVNTGNHLMLYSHLSSVIEPFAINRKIIGFDTFSGFQSITESDGDVTNNDFSKSNLITLKKSIEIFDMNRVQAHIGKTELVIGDAVETIPRWVSENKEAIISLLYLDFDLYQPTTVALENMFDLVPPGGIIAFDEFSYDKFPGETLAFKERLGNKYKLQKFNYHPFIAFFIK